MPLRSHNIGWTVVERVRYPQRLKESQIVNYPAPER